jgi:hypothetical protein
VAKADDETLTADATVDQISAALTHYVNAAADQGSQNGFYSSQYWSNSPAVSQVANKLGPVSFKVLLDVLNQTKSYSKSEEMDSKLILKRQALYKAMKNQVTDTDLPDLIASPAVEALWIVYAHPSWQNDPTVSAFLSKQLADYPPESDQTPNWIADQYVYTGRSSGFDFMTPSQTKEWTILSLAMLDSDEAVQKQLIETIRRGLDGTGTPTIFFCDALVAVSHSRNADLVALAPELMSRLVSIGKFPYYRVQQCVYDLVSTKPDLVKDPAFDSAAIAFLKDAPYSFSVGEHGDWILLARLGDSVSFGDCFSTYFNKDAFSEWGTSQQILKQEFVGDFESNIVSKIVYKGDDDRTQGIKEHYRSATFEAGVWTILGPDQISSAPISALAPSAPPLKLASDRAPVPPPPKVSTPPAPVASIASPNAVPASPAPAPALPDHVSVTARVPIETLDGTGQVTAVSMATVGASYHVIRADGKALIVRDDSGNQYRIASQATAVPSN